MFKTNFKNKKDDGCDHGNKICRLSYAWMKCRGKEHYSKLEAVINFVAKLDEI